MEQHPVPQNVTTFQFRLIGDMTIKQFGYLAGGIILGYIFYKLPLPFFFTWPLGIGSAVLGFGLAFVPVEERPMDVWIASFFKNVYSPTQYVWQKKPPAPSKNVPAAPQKTPNQTELRAAQTVGPPHTHQPVLKQFIELFFSWFKPSTMPMPSPEKTPVVLRVPPAAAAPPQQTAPPQAVLTLNRAGDPIAWLKKLFSANPKVALSPGLEFNNALAPHHPPVSGPPKPPLQPTLRAAPPIAPPPPVSTPHPPTHERVVELQSQLSESFSERERLEKELVALHQQMEQQAKTSLASQQPMKRASMTPIANATSVRIFTPQAATNAGIPKLTTFPNVVTGIIKDHNGNLLSNILITVRDNTDTPLRALKTNKLGQFAASTPLPNGTYLVEIEDPKGVLVFDKIQIPLNGAVSPPIEVVAKSQKQVERDKLAREIFGNQPM